MFDKLAPVPIKNSKHRNLMIFSMSWFLIGTWIDASAHSYLNGDLESFFTPWHAVLYSGYAFSVLSTMYIKNSITYSNDFSKYNLSYFCFKLHLLQYGQR